MGPDLNCRTTRFPLRRAVSIRNLGGNTRWVVGNVGVFGYYRVNYDETTWSSLIEQLNINHQVRTARGGGGGQGVIEGVLGGRAPGGVLPGRGRGGPRGRARQSRPLFFWGGGLRRANGRWGGGGLWN